MLCVDKTPHALFAVIINTLIPRENIETTTVCDAAVAAQNQDGDGDRIEVKLARAY